MDPQVCLTSGQAPLTTAKFMAMRDVLYHEAIGALNWAMLATCPDIVYAVAMVVCFGANPRPTH